MTEQIIKNDLLHSQIPGVPKPPAVIPMPYQNFHSPALPGTVEIFLCLWCLVFNVLIWRRKLGFSKGFPSENDEFTIKIDLSLLAFQII